MPKPDYAIGFPVFSSGHDPFSTGVLSRLSDRSDFQLNPCTQSVTAPHAIAFPAFVHESKRSAGSTTEAGNHLAKSLIWMLHQQDQLRKAAIRCDQTAQSVELPVFGIASVGPQIFVYSTAGSYDTCFVSRHVLCLLMQPLLTLLWSVSTSSKKPRSRFFHFRGSPPSWLSFKRR